MDDSHCIQLIKCLAWDWPPTVTTLDTAIAHYEQQIATHPDHLLAYWKLGLVLGLRGDHEQAQAVWFSALSHRSALSDRTDTVDADLTDLQSLLITAADRLLHPFPHLAQWVDEQRLALNELDAASYLHLGHALALQGELEDAIAQWQTALELDPDQIEGYRALAQVWQKLGHWDEAIAAYEVILSRQPDAPTHHQQALCLMQQARWSEAIAHLQQAIQFMPDTPSAYGDLAYAELRLGHVKQAIAQFQACLSRCPTFAQTYCQWAATASEASINRWENGAFVQALLSSQPIEALFYLGNRLAKSHLEQAAIAVYQQVLALHPNWPDAVLRLSQLNATQPHDLVEHLRQSIQYYPDRADLWLALGQQLQRQQSGTEAIAALRHAVQLQPDEAEAWCSLGVALSQHGQPDEAIAALHKALALHPAYLEARLNLAIALTLTHQTDIAVAEFGELARQNSSLAPKIHSLLTQFAQSGLLNAQSPALHAIFPVATPTQAFATAAEWAIANPAPDCRYIPIASPTSVSLRPPQTIDPFLHFSFRFPCQLHLPAPFVASVPNGRFWLDPDQSANAILTAEGALLADLSPQFPILSPGHPDQSPDQHWIFQAQCLEAPQIYNETIAVLSGLSNDVYFHWLCDGLPRLDLLQQSGIPFSQVDRFLVSGRYPYQREILSAMGIAPEHVLETHENLHIQATQLIVPSFSGTVAWMSASACNFVRRSLLPLAQSSLRATPKRIYISRQLATYRHVINEEALIQLLQPHGFQVVCLERLSVADQVALFAQAEAIVAPHGSGLTNLLFCQTGATVIELFSPHYVYPCYWYLANLVGLEYYYLIGDQPEGTCLHQLIYPNARIEDLYIHPDRLTVLLNQANLV